MIHSQPQRIVMGIHARLKIGNGFRSPGGRIEHRTDRHADDEVRSQIVKADGIHNLGTHFIIGVPVGAVFNPASGGPETVTDLQSSVNTHYDALWLTVDHRFAQRYQMHAAYTLSKALNYANYDQVPFGYPPVDPRNLRREYGPAP